MQNTTESSYTERSQSIQSALWKQYLKQVNPYMLHLKALTPGFMLEIGCGIGRNLGYVGGKGVGVDHNPTSIAHCRGLGYTAFTSEEFKNSEYSKGPSFDSLLMSHLLEHMDHPTRVELLQSYLHLIKPQGKVIMITPQEKGQASDPTHMELVGFDEQAALGKSFGLKLIKSYSFPFMRFMGPYWIYNEFISVWSKES